MKKLSVNHDLSITLRNNLGETGTGRKRTEPLRRGIRRCTEAETRQELHAEKCDDVAVRRVVAAGKEGCRVGETHEKGEEEETQDRFGEHFVSVRRGWSLFVCLVPMGYDLVSWLIDLRGGRSGLLDGLLRKVLLYLTAILIFPSERS